jgi:OOP family OmpA-OmpF porin
VVTVSGHADRLGEAKYNHELALRRAVAVSGYLATHGIPGRALTVREYGEDRPLVSCDGVKGHKALVACLAPNRRAEIVIEITRKR